VIAGGIVWGGDEPEPPPGWWEDWRVALIIAAIALALVPGAWDHDADQAATRDAHRIERLRAVLAAAVTFARVE